MPRGGHNRKTAAEAQQSGTFRKDRHTDPLSIAPGDVTAPTGMSDAERKVWDEYIAPRLAVDVYEPADAPALEMWCVFYVRAREAANAIPPGGVYEVDQGDGRYTFVKHPAVGVLKDMASEFRSLSSRLGLDTLGRLALGDIVRNGPNGNVGGNLPAGAPPAWQPKVVKGGKGT